jgi:hypothetical protein
MRVDIFIRMPSPIQSAHSFASLSSPAELYQPINECRIVAKHLEQTCNARKAALASKALAGAGRRAAAA